MDLQLASFAEMENENLMKLVMMETTQMEKDAI